MHRLRVAYSGWSTWRSSFDMGPSDRQSDSGFDMEARLRALEARTRIAELFLRVPNESVYIQVLDAMLELMDSSMGVFGYIDVRGELICPAVIDGKHGPDARPDERPTIPRVRWKGVWGDAMLDGEPKFSNGPTQLPVEGLTASNVLAVPIMNGGQLIGAILVAERGRPYGAPDVRLLTSVADSVAPVLHARLDRENERSARAEAEAALAQSERKLAARNLLVDAFLMHPGDEVYRALSSVIMDALDSEKTLVGHVDTDGVLVCPVPGGVAGDVDMPPRPSMRFGMESWDGIWSRAFETRSVVWSDGPVSVPTGHGDIRNMLCAPVVHNDNVIGGVVVANPSMDFGDSDVALLTTLAKAIAPLLSERLQRRRSEAQGAIATRQAKSAEEQYFDLLENANDLVQSVDANGRFLYVNKSWLNTLGYTRDEAKALTLWNVLDPTHWKQCMEAFKEVLQGKKVELIETTFRTKDGTTIEVEGNVSCRFEKGKPVGTRGIFRDVTEHRRALRELEEQRDRSRLYLDLLTHDVNNLNQGVVSYMQLMLMRTDLPEEGRRYLQRTLDQTMEISRLIHSVKRLSEVLEGHMAMGSIDARNVLESATERAKSLHRGRTLDIRYDMPSGPVRLCGNELLEEVFAHLFDYIAKTDPSDPVHIEVVVHDEDEGRAWRLEVRGRSKGFVKGLGPDGRGEFDRGTGSVSLLDLGLTIVHEVVKCLDGRMWSERSGDGQDAQGSAIVIVLAKARDDDQADGRGSDSGPRLPIPW